MKWPTVAVVLACARIAAAQPDEPPPPDEPPAPEPQPIPPPPPPPAPRADPGWQLYHETFSELARGKRGHARELAAELVRLHPDHEATSLIRGSGLAMPDQPVDLIERPSKSARAELAAFQTLHGIAVGSELCVIASCNDPTAVLGLVFLGGAAGVTISLNIGELTSGERALINSGTIWGAGNAILLAIASDPQDASTVAGLLLAGQAGGILVGGALFSKHPTAGQVALANSGGEWALVLTGLTMSAFPGGTFSTRDVATTLIAAMDTGIAIGAYLATQIPEVSRGQTLVIDAGGIVGTVAGGGVGILISGKFSDRTTPGAAAVGAAVGLGAAAYFTRDWHHNGGSNATAYVAPVEHGGVAGYRTSW